MFQLPVFQGGNLLRLRSLKLRLHVSDIAPLSSQTSPEYHSQIKRQPKVSQLSKADPPAG